MGANSKSSSSKESTDDQAEKNNSNKDTSEELPTSQNPMSELGARYEAMSISTRNTSISGTHRQATIIKSRSESSLHELKLSIVKEENLNENIDISNNDDSEIEFETLPTDPNSLEAFVALFMVLITLLRCFLRRRNLLS